MDEKPSSAGRRFWRIAVISLWAVREILRTAWRAIRGPFLFALQVAAALIILFEEWGWKPLSEALARLARYAPVARLERWIASLGPYPSLLVFALPTTFLAPLKLVALWLLAGGRYWTATGLFVAAKIAATALVARVFVLTKPSLMQIAWFARAYTWFVPWKDAFFAIIRASWPWRYARMIKNRVRQQVRRWAHRLRPRIRAFMARNEWLAEIIAKLPARWQPASDQKARNIPTEPSGRNSSPPGHA